MAIVTLINNIAEGNKVEQSGITISNPTKSKENTLCKIISAIIKFIKPVS